MIPTISIRRERRKQSVSGSVKDPPPRNRILEGNFFFYKILLQIEKKKLENFKIFLQRLWKFFFKQQGIVKKKHLLGNRSLVTFLILILSWLPEIFLFSRNNDIFDSLFYHTLCMSHLFNPSLCSKNDDLNNNPTFPRCVRGYFFWPWCYETNLLVSEAAKKRKEPFFCGFPYWKGIKDIRWFFLCWVWSLCTCCFPIHHSILK